MSNPLNPPPSDGVPRPLYLWLYTLWMKLGEASNTAPISVSGNAATSTTITTTLPIAKGGTGATDPAGAAAALGVQTAIDPATPGDVPVSDGTGFITRKLTAGDVLDVISTSMVQSKRDVALTAASGAAVGDSGDTSVTWDSAFADANYSLTFTVKPATGVPIASIVSKSSTGCVVRITNATAVMCTGTGDLQAVHD